METDAPIQLLHLSDPNGGPDKTYHWSFVYLHGEAESFNERHAEDQGWEWRAGDLFDASGPIPEHDGEYYVTLYGLPVLVVLHTFHDTDYGYPPFRKGRAALASDHKALEHCRKPQDWR